MKCSGEATTRWRTLAQITGGRAYFPQSGKDFVPTYKEIASALRHQYVLGIAPAHDGQYHALYGRGDGRETGRLAKPGEYRIFARAGYLAPEAVTCAVSRRVF